MSTMYGREGAGGRDEGPSGRAEAGERATRAAHLALAPLARRVRARAHSRGGVARRGAAAHRDEARVELGRAVLFAVLVQPHVPSLSQARAEYLPRAQHDSA